MIYRCQEHEGMLAQSNCICCELSLYIKRLKTVVEAARIEINKRYPCWEPLVKSLRELDELENEVKE